MGEQHVVVDTAALGAVADRLDATAETIDAARLRLSRLGFSGAHAGRAHMPDGDALRRALERWPAELARWSRAGVQIAAALRAGGAGYCDAERGCADGLG